MIKGSRKNQHIKVEDVLSKISEYDIFMFYMPHKNWKLNTPTLSPFRRERNPSFLIGTKSGRVQYIDFTDTSIKGGCFDFVKQMFGISDLQEALQLINKDFGLGLSEKTNIDKYKRIVSTYVQPKIEEEKKYSIIQVITRKFTSRELAYWNQYHQDEFDLKANNVYAVKKVYLNKQLFYLKESELTFGYLYDDKWKIYSPYKEKGFKWVPNNVPITAMDGRADIVDCHTAFINKSKKDYMVMKKIFPTSCAIQNEGIGCFSEENVKYIKDNSKFQLLSFDSDEVGVKNSQKITKSFGFGYINAPRKYLTEGIKDWADLAKAYGMKEVENYLKQKKII